MKRKIESKKTWLIHYVLAVFFLIVIIYHWRENPTGMLILFGLLILSLILNKTNTLILENDKIILKSRYGIFKTSKILELQSIDSLELDDRHVDTGFHEGLVGWNHTANIVTGREFYVPQHYILITPLKGEKIKLKVNLKEKEIKEFIRLMKSDNPEIK